VIDGGSAVAKCVGDLSKRWLRRLLSFAGRWPAGVASPLPAWWLPMIDEVRDPQPTMDRAAALLAELIPGDHGLRVDEVRPPGRLVCTAGPAGLQYALGGSVSGPTIFKLVDYVAFLTVNVCVGPMRSAVLAQCSISFLEPAQPGPLRIAVEIVQLGMRTAVTDVRVTDGRDWLVATASLHFSLPGRRERHIAGPAGAAGQPASPIGRTA
jgi:acyl-coenzyme A thioesterase PaaI-like protein